MENRPMEQMARICAPKSKLKPVPRRKPRATERHPAASLGQVCGVDLTSYIF
jgi:hypothetical protein